MSLWEQLAERYDDIPQPWWAVFLIYELLLLGAWLLEARLLRRIRRDSGDPIDAAKTDSSYNLLWLRHFAILQLPLIPNGRWQSPLGYTWTVTITGVAIALAGLAIRLHAISYLRENFTYVVGVAEKQSLVTTGPYKYIRHPAYTGLFIYFTGLGVTLCELYMVFVIWGYVGYVIYRRVKREESELAEHFGDQYREWKARTKQLVPFLF